MVDKGYELKIFWKKGYKHFTPDFKYYSKDNLQDELDKLNHNFNVERVEVIEVALTECSVCHKHFPDDFGGNMCPRCEKIYYDTREEQLSEKERNW